MRRGLTASSILVITLCALLPTLTPSAFGKVFSLDPASPFLAASGGSPADLYLPPAVPGGPPVLYVPAGGLGLLPGDDIDAFSWGFDKIELPLSFSTDWSALGAVAPGNAVCVESGANPLICGIGAPFAPEVAGDMFTTFGQGTASHYWDGDGIPGTAPPLGLTEAAPPVPGGQDP